MMGVDWDDDGFDDGGFDTHQDGDGNDDEDDDRTGGLCDKPAVSKRRRYSMPTKQSRLLDGLVRRGAREGPVPFVDISNPRDLPSRRSAAKSRRRAAGAARSCSRAFEA